MELYQLEHFVAVVEEHSFTARPRGLSDQRRSVTVRKLEKELVSDVQTA
jgi:DNA-binding transcriptional LysR family regulator